MSAPLRFVAVALSLIVFSSNAHAQSTVGFSEPDSTYHLERYRLPDWGYSRFQLALNGNGRGRVDFDTDAESSQYLLNVGPRWHSFYQSERRVTNLLVEPRFSYHRNASENEQLGGGTREEVRKEYDGSVRVQGRWDEFFAPGRFGFVEGDGGVQYYRSSEQSNSQSTSDSKRVNYEFNGRIGLGIGRVREVTPVIRALRIQERLNALGEQVALSPDQIQSAARQFARKPGYRAIYDRPDKYFWNAFFDRLDDAVGSLTPFEMFYLADVVQEDLGRHLEGADVRVGPHVAYRNRLEKIDPDAGEEQRNHTIDTRVGAFAEGRWFTHPSLSHQVGLRGTIAYENALTSGNEEAATQLDAEAQWLWLVADRVRLDSRLRANLRFVRFEAADALRMELYRASTSLFYFIENSIALSAGVNALYSGGRFSVFEGTVVQHNRESLDWSVSVGLNVFLHRALR